MARIEKTVFLSYRRTNQFHALAIFQNLKDEYDVFIDFNGIASGDFESAILDNIKTRAHFIVLLTPSALDGCGDPADWLRREIETAIEYKRNIVPMTFEGFDFNNAKTAGQLSGTLESLRRYHAVSVPAEYFEAAMKRLRTKFLDVPLDTVTHPPSRSARQVSREQQTAAGNAPAVTADDLTAERWFERGIEAADIARIQIGDVVGGLQDYDDAIQLKPDFAEALFNRANLRAEQGDAAGARQDYDTVIRLKRDNPDAFNRRGLLRAKQGDVAGAREDYDTAIRLKPDHAEAFFNRAVLHIRQDDMAGVREDLDTAIRLKPDAATVFVRAILRRDQGDVAGAREDYDATIRLKPDHAEAFYSRAILRAKQGDVAGAREDYDTAIRLKPGNPDWFTNRGIFRAQQHDMAGAREDFDTAIRLRPDSANAFYNRGILREQQGDAAGAQLDFRTAKRLSGQ